MEKFKGNRIEIETLEVAGFRSAFEALRLPKGRECRTESNFQMSVNGNCLGTITDVTLNEKDLHLASCLQKNSDCEAKVLRGIIAYAKITAPMYFFGELETYRHGHERLCSSSQQHIDFARLSGEELEAARDQVPAGYKYTKIDFFSYQCLRHIFQWRRNHRLPMWHTFCDWICHLPYANELILVGLDTNGYPLEK